MRKTQVRSLGQEGPLEKGMAIHFSTIAWRIPRTEEPGRLQSMGSQRVRHDWATSLTHSLTHVLLFYSGAIIFNADKGAISFPRERLARSGDILDCHNGGDATGI